MQKIIVASNNTNKIKELNNLFKNNNSFSFISQQQYNCPVIAETGKTFVENALLKARNAAQFCKLPALADDSGICVDILNNQPGIFSARYAAINNNNSTDQENITKLINNLKQYNATSFKAKFIAVIALLKTADDPLPLISTGIWHGEIILTPRGKHGFGYDPIFYIPELNKTAAELTLAEKQLYSHRAKAINNLFRLIHEYY